MRKASKRGWGRGWGADDTSGCRRHISLTCPDSLLLCLHKDRVALRKGVAHAAESYIMLMVTRMMSHPVSKLRKI